MPDFLFPFIRSFIALFIITDSLGNIPFFLSLTEGETLEERRKIFTTAVLTGFVMLVAFLVVGLALLNLFSVTIDDFKIAGGVLLFWIAIELMVRGKFSVEHKDEVGVVPLGSPLLVGPGALTTSIVLLKLYGYGVVISAIVACFLIIGLILYYAEPIHKILGKNGSLILTKISAILIAAIAVQFIRQGISAIFQL